MTDFTDTSPIMQNLGRKFVSDTMIASIVSDRVYCGAVPQNVSRPYIVIWQVITEPFQDLQGEVGWSKSIIQLDGWADGVDALIYVKRIGNAIRDIFKNGFRGKLVDAGIDIDSVMIRRYDLTSQRKSDGGDDILRRCSIDLEIIHVDDPGGVA